MTRLGSAHHQLGLELVELHDGTPDEGVTALLRALVALRNAPLSERAARALVSCPEFCDALVHACDLADEMEGV